MADAATNPDRTLSDVPLHVLDATRVLSVALGGIDDTHALAGTRPTDTLRSEEASLLHDLEPVALRGFQKMHELLYETVKSPEGEDEELAEAAHDTLVLTYLACWALGRTRPPDAKNLDAAAFAAQRAVQLVYRRAWEAYEATGGDEGDLPIEDLEEEDHGRATRHPGAEAAPDTASALRLATEALKALAEVPPESDDTPYTVLQDARDQLVNVVDTLRAEVEFPSDA